MNQQRLNYETFVEDSFGENCYVLFARPRGDCWIIDPCFDSEPVRHWVVQRGLRPVLLINTHCHGDHIAGNAAIKQAFPDVQLCAPAGETELLTDTARNLSAPFGVPVTSPPADRSLSPGESLELDGLAWRVLDLSGHSPAGIGLYCAAESVAIVGDAVFAGSIGRTDFPGSDHGRLIDNVTRHLQTLPDDTCLLAGHGAPTTVGHERKTNPFLT